MTSFEKWVQDLPQEVPGLQESHYFSETRSTQEEALLGGKSGAAIPSLWVSDYQTAGKGRRERTWESPRELGLYFSLLLRPNLPLDQSPLLTLAAGLGLARALKNRGLENLILKWPNDILVQKKKIAGILTEMVSDPKGMAFIVLGVGINVSQKLKDFSSEIREIAGSLEELSRGPWDRKILIKEAIIEILSEVQGLSEKGPDYLLKRWELESGMLEKKISALLNGEEVIGEVKGLNPQGHLRILKSDGSELTLIAEDTALL